MKIRVQRYADPVIGSRVIKNLLIRSRSNPMSPTWTTFQAAAESSLPVVRELKGPGLNYLVVCAHATPQSHPS